MRTFLLQRFTLLLVLTAFPVPAQERAPNVTRLHLSSSPKQEVPQVNVASGIATVLRFEQPVNPEGTQLLGGEGRFERPLACGRFAVLMPLQEVAEEDRFLLRVTFQDGTEVPFTVKGHKRLVDQQVNVFLKPDSPEALRARYEHASHWMKKYQEENERLRTEATSVDHAFAALLASGSVASTPFAQKSKWRIDLGGVVMNVYIYSSKPLAKAAVLFHVNNRELDEPWKLKEVQLSTLRKVQTHETPLETGEKRAFALRQNRDEIPPGESGMIAVVADKSAVDSQEGPVQLTLELFRQDGLQQALVYLDPRLVYP